MHSIPLLHGYGHKHTHCQYSCLFCIFSGKKSFFWPKMVLFCQDWGQKLPKNMKKHPIFTQFQANCGQKSWILLNSSMYLYINCSISTIFPIFWTKNVTKNNLRLSDFHIHLRTPKNPPKKGGGQIWAKIVPRE